MKYSFNKSLLLMLFLGLWSHASLANISTVDSDHWSNKYDELFKKHSARYFGPHFNWRWFKAQAIAESGLKTRAVSGAGARGIMQIIPATFKEIKRDQAHIEALETAAGSIAAGIFYNRELFRKWQEMPEQDRLFLAFASYNAGYYRVLKSFKRAKIKDWRNISATLPKETRNYVARIRRLMEENEAIPQRINLLAAYFAA